ncbi:hypothetical protein OOZ19_25620 [Saccharopolyspora sp. NFXS83]|uniref:hypothetical protein n=1 Tax=Saccharopolyspora sp. NFXS83 TaxID=2993560 RepID=UPI00224B1C6C|nr:hypothetical protein [Saccharopolyspora sp. NFXS83]MCX2733636.1 hypothetical protein [Saccharopolyspora sp. NFXS83]
MDDKIARLVAGEPQREWLCRCSDDDEEMAVCTVGVASGDVEVFGPEYRGYFRLRSSEIAVFRRALDEAITLAEEDLARKAARPAESAPQSSKR